MSYEKFKTYLQNADGHVALIVNGLLEGKDTDIQGLMSLRLSFQAVIDDPKNGYIALLCARALDQFESTLLSAIMLQQHPRGASQAIVDSLWSDAYECAIEFSMRFKAYTSMLMREAGKPAEDRSWTESFVPRKDGKDILYS